MRTIIRIVGVAALAFGAVASTAIPGGAGAPAATNTVIVEKEVIGDVPAGTTFTVEVTCESQLDAHAAAVVPVEITFDENGDPTSDNSLTTPAGTRCTATETEDGGATSTTYDCDMEHGLSDQNGSPFLGNCGPDDNQATFGDVVGDTATITVTNTFTTTSSTTTTTTRQPTPPVTPVAQPVRATPAFTG